MPGHKWTPAQRAKFTATMERREDTKTSSLPQPKNAEYIVYRGSVYKRINKIKVVR